MCVHMYSCVHVCMCVHFMYCTARVIICVFVCLCVHVYDHVYMWYYACTCGIMLMYCTAMCMYMCSCVHVYMYIMIMCTCVYMYIMLMYMLMCTCGVCSCILPCVCMFVYSYIHHILTVPFPSLKMFQGLSNLRILACGGDGTVGWVLSILDTLDIRPCPPIAVLPIGTGNDLARVFNWGAVSDVLT